MIAAGAAGFTYTVQDILANAPNQSGVYAIYNTGWLYIGESGDIQRRLLEHINDPTSVLSCNNPTGFCFELSPSHQRVERQNALMAQFFPTCNQMWG